MTNRRIIFVVLVIAMVASPIYAQSSKPPLQSEAALDFKLSDQSSETDRAAVVSIMAVADSQPDEPSAPEGEVFRGYDHQGSPCYYGLVMGFITVDGEPYEWRWSGSEWLRYDTSSGSRYYFDYDSFRSHGLTYIATGTF